MKTLYEINKGYQEAKNGAFYTYANGQCNEEELQEALAKYTIQRRKYISALSLEEREKQYE